MNSLTKRIVYGSLLAGSTAFFLPTVLGAKDGPPAPPPDVPASGASVGSPESPTGSPGVAPVGGRELVVSARNEEPMIQDLEDTLARLESFLPGDRKSQQGLVDLWAAGRPPTGTDSGREAGQALSIQSVEPTTSLESFLNAHPLRGIIHVPGDSSALLKGRIVRVGDELFPGAFVRDIESKALVIALADDVVRLRLPGLRARPRSSDEASTEQDSASTQTREGDDDQDDQ